MVFGDKKVVNKISKSKSTSHMDELIIIEDSCKILNQTIDQITTGRQFEKLSDLRTIIEENTTIYPQTDVIFNKVQRIMQLHQLYIESNYEKFSNQKITSDFQFFESLPRLGQHYQFKELIDALFGSKYDKNHIKFFSCLIKNLIYYMVYCEKLFDNFTFFEIDIKTMCSRIIMDSDNTECNEVCIILLKLINEIECLEFSKKKQPKDKYLLVVRSNEIENELERELLENVHLGALSRNSSVDLCLKLLEALTKHGSLTKECPDQFAENSCIFELVGNLNDTDEKTNLTFGRSNLVKEYLFIKIEQEWLYLNCSESIKSIIKFIQLKFPINSEIINKLEAVLEINKRRDITVNVYEILQDSIVFESNINDSNIFKSNDTLITQDLLDKFDYEAGICTNTLTNDLEKDLLQLIKRLLVSNLVENEVELNSDHIIGNCHLNSIFKSIELEQILHSVLDKTLPDENNNQMNSMCETTTWHMLGEYIKIDSLMMDKTNSNFNIENLKKLLISAYQMIKKFCLKPRFRAKFRSTVWLESVLKAKTRNNLKFLQYILNENIIWTLAETNCQLCHKSDIESTKSFPEIFNNPSELIKEACDVCGLTFHLKCYKSLNHKLFENKSFSVKICNRKYTCNKCVNGNSSLSNEALQASSIYVNNRKLRNTNTRKLKTLNQDTSEHILDKKRKKTLREGSVKRPTKKTKSFYCESGDDDLSIPLSQFH